ncbi:fimbrial protein [Escherichia coli]|nr:fimbrial protein [Escherichia coli]
MDNLRFKGNLIVPDCTMNNGNPVEINFGDIETQTLVAANTGYHWENIRVPVNCPYSLGVPKIRLTGSQATESRNSIKTSRYDTEKLVIYLHQGTKDNLGKAIELGIYQNIASNAISNTGGARYEVRLAAGVGREGGMELLTAGPFEASASMEVRYE